MQAGSDFSWVDILITAMYNVHCVYRQTHTGKRSQWVVSWKKSNFTTVTTKKLYNENVQGDGRIDVWCEEMLYAHTSYVCYWKNLRYILAIEESQA